MSDQYIGEVRLFAGNFAPAGWALCNGQLLAISQNTALFSLLGTAYGGDGRTIFGLPDLRGHAVMHQGQGPGLTLHSVGETGGSEYVPLNSSEMPAHTHPANCVSGPGPAVNPSGNLWSADTRSEAASYITTGPNATMSPRALGVAGGSQPHNNLQPYLVLNYIIALRGIFPPRS